jgi:hypothetical protein
MVVNIYLCPALAIHYIGIPRGYLICREVDSELNVYVGGYNFTALWRWMFGHGSGFENGVTPGQIAERGIKMVDVKIFRSHIYYKLEITLCCLIFVLFNYPHFI